MKISKIYYKDIKSILQKLDFTLIRQKGSHCFFRNEKSQKTTVIPKHPNEEFSRNLLNKIIKKDLEISREEFFKLLK